MAVLAWPAGLNPARISAHLRANSRVQTSPWTRSVQTQERPGARWEFTLEFDRLRRSEMRGLEVLIAQLRGSAGRVRVPHFARAAAAGSALGTPVVRNRANALRYSELFTDAAWSKTGVTAALSGVSPPQGVAFEVTESGSSGEHFVLQTITVTDGAYGLSALVRAGTGTSRYANLRIFQGAPVSANKIQVFVDLQSGTIVGTPIATATAIESLGDGWYRVSATATLSSAAQALCGVTIAQKPSGVASYTGDGTSSILVAAPTMVVGDSAGLYLATTDTAIASQPSTGTTLYTGGWDASESGLLLPADIVTANDEMKRVCAQVDSDAWGNAAITIEPPLRASPNNGAALAVASPTAYMMLIGDAEGAVEYARTHGSCVLSFLEAFA